jgi:hypothetical protein
MGRTLICSRVYLVERVVVEKVEEQRELKQEDAVQQDVDVKSDKHNIILKYSANIICILG